MSKIKSIVQRSFIGVVSGAVLLGLLAAGHPGTAQAQSCNPLIGAGITVAGPYPSSPGFIHIGETATIHQVTVFVPTGSSIDACSVTNLKAWVVYPNNSFEEWLDLSASGVVLDPNGISSITCPGASPNCLSFNSTYTIKAGDLGAGLSFTTNWPSGFSFNFANSGAGNQVQFAVAGSGATIHSPPGAAQPSLTQPLTVLQPCVGITKLCSSNCPTYGSPISFSGVISNCSVLQSNAPDGTLTIQSVTDDPTATITLAATTSTGRSYDGTLQQNESISYTGSYTPTPGCGPFSDTITVIAADETGFTVTNSATAMCEICTTPCVQVTKDCGPAAIDLAQGSFPVSGSVTNCGNVPLSGILLRDRITYSNANDGVLVVTNTVSLPGLAIGGVESIPTLTITNLLTTCGTISDFFTVIATNLCGSSTVSAESATCVTVVTNTPCISVVKGCGVAFVDISSPAYTVTASVTNCGTEPLSDVYVVDTITDGSGHVSFVTNVIGTLGAGAGITTNNTITAECGTNTDFYTAYGTGPCGQVATANSQTCTTILPCTPEICVSKLVTCAPASGIAGCGPSLDYEKSASGIAGTNNPAFCYQIIVNNCGQVGLTNVTLTDSVLTGNNTPLSGFPSTLAVGQSATNYFGLSWGVGSHTNTVNASGQSAVTGQTVTTNASAETVVVPAAVSCSITLYSTFDLDGDTNDNNVTLPATTTNTPVEFTLTVCNNSHSNVDLSVSLSGVPALFTDGTLTTPLDVPAATNIAAGDCITIQGWMSATCTNAPINVVVQGTVLANTSFPCIYDTFGNAITTAPSTCTATIQCETPISCRVTGGGTLVPDTFSTNCIVVATTLYDANAPNLVVDHISHGGQLGAPFSQMDCSKIVLNNPCIRGEWSHTRHYDNQANGSQDIFDMTFHSANPNTTGHFDTLDCACLPCCGNTNGELKAPPPGWSNFRFQVCNPDDRRICGPLPSPAPANAIIFTGIGTFSPSTNSVSGNGKKAAAYYVIFRVYIEDRSEPGGAHPGGQNEPVTIYCFQAWDTGVEVVQTKKEADVFSTLATGFRLALAQDSCAFMEAISTSAVPQGSLPSTTITYAGNPVPADVVDQGPLNSGSQQIHPSTGATCP